MPCPEAFSACPGPGRLLPAAKPRHGSAWLPAALALLTALAGCRSEREIALEAQVQQLQGQLSRAQQHLEAARQAADDIDAASQDVDQALEDGDADALNDALDALGAGQDALDEALEKAGNATTGGQGQV